MTPANVLIVSKFMDVFENFSGLSKTEQWHFLSMVFQVHRLSLRHYIRWSNKARRSENHLEELETKDFYQTKYFTLGAPKLLIGKKHGGKRLCINYNGLNQVTIKKHYGKRIILDT